MANRKPTDARRNLFHPRLREPDWLAWQHIQNAELWEAAALSCGIAPSCVVGWVETRPIEATKPVAKFQNRLRRAIADLKVNGGQLIGMDDPAEQSETRVQLGTFRAWIEANGLTVPADFPSVIPRDVPNESAPNRRERIGNRVQELVLRKRISLSQAFREVAAEEISTYPGHEGKCIGPETVKGLYYEWKKKHRGTGPPTPPAPPTPPTRR